VPRPFGADLRTSSKTLSPRRRALSRRKALEAADLSGCHIDRSPQTRLNIGLGGSASSKPPGTLASGTHRCSAEVCVLSLAAGRSDPASPAEPLVRPGPVMRTLGQQESHDDRRHTHRDQRPDRRPDVGGAGLVARYATSNCGGFLERGLRYIRVASRRGRPARPHQGRDLHALQTMVQVLPTLRRCRRLRPSTKEPSSGCPFWARPLARINLRSDSVENGLPGGPPVQAPQRPQGLAGDAIRGVPLHPASLAFPPKTTFTGQPPIGIVSGQNCFLRTFAGASPPLTGKPARPRRRFHRVAPMNTTEDEAVPHRSGSCETCSEPERGNRSLDAGWLVRRPGRVGQLTSVGPSAATGSLRGRRGGLRRVASEVVRTGCGRWPTGRWGRTVTGAELQGARLPSSKRESLGEVLDGSPKAGVGPEIMTSDTSSVNHPRTWLWNLDTNSSHAGSSGPPGES
jgi:hypothetical protein